jgi:hypothetical protein
VRTRTCSSAVPLEPEEEMPFPEETPFPEPLRLRLRRRVLSLDYPACSRLLCRLLTDLGYQDVTTAGRTTLRGYNRPGGGGWDIAATLPAGIGSRRVIVRLKHTPHHRLEPDARDIHQHKDVHQRCVDELRGAVLRAGASEGLLVTTAAFSLTARRLAAQGTTKGSVIAPVRLVDGDEMIELLLAHRVGIHEVFIFPFVSRKGWPFPGIRRLEIDEAFFRRIEVKHKIEGTDQEDDDYPCRYLCRRDHDDVRPTPRIHSNPHIHSTPHRVPGRKRQSSFAFWRVTVRLVPDQPTNEADSQSSHRGRDDTGRKNNPRRRR